MDGGAPTFRVMDVVRVTVELPDQVPVVVLQEAEGPMRELAFRVGMPEGVALANALRRVLHPRPQTHELMATAIQRLGADVIAVRLVGRSGATYLAELDLMASRGREVISCRPSDGLVLALRQPTPAPVLADERLLAGDGDVAPGPVGEGPEGEGP
ncbi:MAG: bifunctional nuclease family protein [Acidimicrobiales bacterium]